MAVRKYKICAHRGLSGVMPENTLPSFAAAIALGADEIEFDVRLTSDLKMIVCHDDDVNRVSDRKGAVGDYDLDTLMRCNAGSYINWYVGFCTPEQVIERFAGRVVMNIHIAEFHPDFDVPAELRRLLYHYDATDSAYFSARDEQLATVCALRRILNGVPCSPAPLPDRISSITPSVMRAGACSFTNHISAGLSSIVRIHTI